MEVDALIQIVAMAVLTMLATAVGWLVRTVGRNERQSHVLEVRLSALEQDDLRGKVDRFGERLAKTEAVHEQIEKVCEDITKVHERTDKVLATTNEVKGALNAMDKTMSALLEALIPRRE